jgi:hypothetical protein
MKLFDILVWYERYTLSKARHCLGGLLTYCTIIGKQAHQDR